MTAVTRAAVVAEARSWLAVPWLHQGRSRAGVDCAGLIICVARDLGLSTFDCADYPREPTGELLRVVEKHLRAIEIAAAQSGDVAVLRFRGAPTEHHLAFVTEYRPAAGQLALLHALNRTAERGRASRVVEHRLDAYWRSLIVAAFALPGVAD